MNEKALEAAKEKLQHAREKVSAMTAATDIRILARLWEEFLTLQQQVFLRLSKAFERGHSKSWSDAVINEKRSDDMLRYVMHARNADEHGINSISEANMGKVTINPRQGMTLSVNRMVVDTRGPTPIIAMDPETAANATITFIPASVKVLPVRDRGVDYNPPTSHLGDPIISSPISIAEMTISYLEKKIHEGETRFRQPSGSN
jgi:hypothetical protein